MKILVYGAGVLGSLYAARLHQSGQTVSILARGQRAADIRKHGVVLRDAFSTHESVTPVDVVERLQPDDAYDWVLVIMRKNQVAEALPTLAANTHTPNVLFLMNNAAGPGQLVEALGYHRVVLGFPGAGGIRQGHVVRYVAGRGRRRARTTIGEIDGQITPRLQQLASTLEGAGFGVTIEHNIEAWLKTHVAVVSPMANALYMTGGDNYRLARTQDGLVLMVRAIHEGFRVLRVLCVPITPPIFNALEWIPEPVAVALLSRFLATEAAKLGLAGHANAARDEMKCLADEFRALARSSSIPTPAIEQLRRYIDPEVTCVAEGSDQLPMDWRGVWIGMAIVGTLLAARRLLRRRR